MIKPPQIPAEFDLQAATPEPPPPAAPAELDRPRVSVAAIRPHEPPTAPWSPPTPAAVQKIPPLGADQRADAPEQPRGRPEPPDEGKLAAAERAARWKTALHEAGHVVAAVAFGEMPAGAVVFANGEGGLAYCAFALAPTPTAIIRAAGRAAEALVDRFPPPARPTDIAEAWLAPAKPLPVQAVVEHKRDHARATCDERTVAEWAITGHENEPETWAGRVAWARHQAAALVADAVDLVVAVAARLHLAGHITRVELKLLFPDPAGHAGTAPAQPEGNEAR